MNKRKAKKYYKKMELFINSWAFSYREVKQLDRSYHEFILMQNRRIKYNKLHNIHENIFDF